MKKPPQNKKPSILLLLILFLTFVLVRYYRLPQRVNFSMEPGMILSGTRQMWTTKTPALVSLPSSVRTASDRAFFHGPWIYYLLLPVMLVFNWDPMAGAWFFILTNALGMLLLYSLAYKKYGPRVAFFTFLFYTFSYKLLISTSFIWNPNILPANTALILVLWDKFVSLKKPALLFSIGFLLGFGAGWHYFGSLVILISLAWMLSKKQPLKNFFTVGAGLVLGLSPLILFELRHNFYNLNTIFLILTEGTNKDFRFPPPFYYFLSVVPFILLTLSLALDQVFRKSRLLGAALVLAFLIFSLKQIIPPPQSGYSLAKGWNYPGLQKAAQIIVDQNKTNYNVANILSGDTRDYALRYLLEINGHPPASVENYPGADYLFVISRFDQSKTISYPVWELSSFTPSQVADHWPIQNGINLYLLEKEKL